MFLQDAIVVCHGGGREGDGEFWRSGCGVVSLQGAIVVCYFCKKDNSHFWWSGRLGALFFFALALPSIALAKISKPRILVAIIQYLVLVKKVGIIPLKVSNQVNLISAILKLVRPISISWIVCCAATGRIFATQQFFMYRPDCLHLLS